MGLDAELDALVAGGLTGAVAVAVGPGFRWEGASGLADVKNGEALTQEHRFRIGSVTKTFVAALVLQLVEEGVFELDGDAGSLADGATIRQLLNHTAGFPNFEDDVIAMFEPYRRDPAHRSDLGPRDLLARVKERPRRFQPGEGWSYSGSNYLILGLIVEDATGASLAEQLRRRIFEPLELAGTELPPDWGALPGMARGYLPPDNPVLPGPGPELVDVTGLGLPYNPAGGGMVSTARDVAAFLEALLGGRLVSSESRAELLRTVPSDWPESDGYGLGIERVTSLMGIAPSPCGTTWGHIGLWPGYGTIALASEPGDRQVVVLTNGDIVTTDDHWDALGRLVWAAYCR
jgi:D-alanyl-D-alanine carboxypeptidase